MNADRLLEAALRGDRRASQALVDTLAPVVQVRVARALRQRGALGGRDLRQEMQDLVQDVFTRLFADDARALRSWDPARGASLTTFVGIVAHREVVSILRSAKRNPFTEDPKAHPPSAARAVRPDEHVAARQRLDRLLEALRERLSEQGYRVFELLWCEEKPVNAVCEELGLSRDAVYAWRSRIRKLARELAEPAIEEAS